MPVPRLQIVYHSQSGTCERIAKRMTQRVRNETIIPVSSLRSWDAGADELLGCSGLVLVCAENFGWLAGGMQNLLNRAFYPLLAANLILPVAAVISAGNDGRGAVQQLERVVSGLGWKWVSEPITVRGDLDDAMLERAAEPAVLLAAGLELGMF